MFKIQTYNKIASAGLERFPREDDRDHELWAPALDPLPLRITLDEFLLHTDRQEPVVGIFELIPNPGGLSIRGRQYDLLQHLVHIPFLVQEFNRQPVLIYDALKDNSIIVKPYPSLHPAVWID